jgi:Trp operon repressor
MIPSLSEHGYLPAGVYDCSLEEAAARFAVFHGSDRRTQLWKQFVQFIEEAKESDLVEAILIDGSFVTSKPEPNDIDLVLAVAPSLHFASELRPAQYNLLSQRRVRRRFGFDIVVVKNGSENFEQAVAFFQEVKQRPGLKKGILRIKL